MEEKKIKLLELIKDLDFPFLPQESQEHLNRLSEEDLDFLVRVFTEVKEYRRTIDTVANLVDPEGYKKIQEDHYKKMRDFDLEYTVRLSDVLKDSDQKLLQKAPFLEKATHWLQEKINSPQPKPIQTFSLEDYTLQNEKKAF